MIHSTSSDVLANMSDNELLAAHRSREWIPGDRERGAVEDEIELRGIDLSAPITPTPKTLEPWTDAVLLAEWDQVSLMPGDPWSDALATEIERRNLDFSRA